MNLENGYLKNVTRNGGKMYVAYINNHQHKQIGKALTREGFKRTGTSYNPNHNTTIYQYTKIC